MARVLVDASNLHVGGGVQVGGLLPRRGGRPGVVVPCRSVRLAGLRHVRGVHCGVEQRHRAHALTSEPARRRSILAIGATVGARTRSIRRVLRRLRPEYGLSRARKRISGFADVTTVVQPPQSVQATGLYRRGRFEARKRVSRASFARQDALIAESEEMKSALVALGRSPKRSTSSRTPTTGSLTNRRVGSPSEWIRSSGDTLLAYATRPYAHKNLDFLPLVRREFRRDTG